MGSVKSVLTGGCLAVALLAMTASAAHAVLIPSSVTGTVRDQGGNGTPDVVFSALSPPNVFEVFHPPNTEDRGIVEFDISGQAQPFGQAILTLTRVGTSGVGLPIQVFGYGGAGANGVVELADFDLGAFVTSFNVPAALEVTIDVTTFVNSQIGSSNFVGFNLRLNDNVSTEQVNFVVSPGGATPLPTLDLTGTPTVMPEPGTLVVLGLGLLGLGFAGRRRAR